MSHLILLSTTVFSGKYWISDQSLACFLHGQNEGILFCFAYIFSGLVFCEFQVAETEYATLHMVSVYLLSNICLMLIPPVLSLFISKLYPFVPDQVQFYLFWILQSELFFFSMFMTIILIETEA